MSKWIGNLVNLVNLVKTLKIEKLCAETDPSFLTKLIKENNWLHVRKKYRNKRHGELKAARKNISQLPRRSVAISRESKR